MLSPRSELLKTLAAVLLLVWVTPLPADAATPYEAAATGSAFVVARQQPSGRFFSEQQPVDAVAETLYAISTHTKAKGALDKSLGRIGEDGPQAAKERAAYGGRIIMGLVAAGANPRNHAGFDYVASVASHLNPVTGIYDSSNLYSNALAVLGLIEAKAEVPDRALGALADNACAAGGFAHDLHCLSGRPDIDTTAVVTRALVTGGWNGPEVARARSFLLGAANDERAYGYEPGKPTNANSTGLALWAIAALGEDPWAEPWASNGLGPVRALIELQAADGRFRWMRGRAPSSYDDYATVQAIIGLGPWSARPADRPAEAASTAGGATVSGDVRAAGASETPSDSPSTTPLATGPEAGPGPPALGTHRSIDGIQDDADPSVLLLSIGGALAAVVTAGIAWRLGTKDYRS